MAKGKFLTSMPPEPSSSAVCCSAGGGCAAAVGRQEKWHAFLLFVIARFDHCLWGKVEKLRRTRFDGMATGRFAAILHRAKFLQPFCLL